MPQGSGGVPLRTIWEKKNFTILPCENGCVLYREASVPAIYWEVKCMKKVCMLLLIAMAVLLTSCTIGGLPINRYAYMRVDYTAAANDRFEELIAAVIFPKCAARSAGYGGSCPCVV